MFKKRGAVDRMGERFLREKNDLIRARCALQGLLKEAAAADAQRVHIITVADTAYTHKAIYRVCDERLCDQVRQKMLGLGRLRAYLEEQGETLRTNARIWLPAVADPKDGDTLINLTASENWVTREVSATELRLEAEAGDDSQPLPALCLQARYRLCRRSGHHYRVAIRNPEARNAQGELCGRRVQALNDYALILGESLPLNLPRRGVRAKNRHAWRGVAPALFTLIGARGQQWLVYPGTDSSLISGSSLFCEC